MLSRLFWWCWQNLVVPLAMGIAWLWRHAVVPAGQWTWANRKALIQAWLLFGLCVLFVGFSSLWIAAIGAFFESLLNAVAPRAEPWHFLIVLPQPPPQT